jgi:hypothetical protein
MGLRRECMGNGLRNYRLENLWKRTRRRKSSKSLLGYRQRIWRRWSCSHKTAGLQTSGGEWRSHVMWYWLWRTQTSGGACVLNGLWLCVSWLWTRAYRFKFVIWLSDKLNNILTSSIEHNSFYTVLCYNYVYTWWVCSTFGSGNKILYIYKFWP